MGDLWGWLERRASRFEPPPDGLGRLLSRAAHRQRSRRVGSALVGLVLSAALGFGLWSSLAGRDGEAVPGHSPAPTPDRSVLEGLPRLLAVERDGDVWVVDGGKAARWTDIERTPTEPCGYFFGRFGPDGAVYASRLGRGRVIIDRITGPGEVERLLDLPFAYEGRFGCETGQAPHEALGYLESFSVSEEGLLLLKHVVLDPDTCDPAEGYCPEYEPEEVWFVELRPWSALDQEGRTAGPVGGTRPLMGNFIPDVLVAGETADGREVAFVQSVNKFFGWQYLLVSVPDLSIRPCCPGDEDVAQTLGTFAPSPAGDALVFTDSGYGTPVRGAEFGVPRLYLLRKGSSPEVIYRDGDKTPFGDALAWTDDRVAFSWHFDNLPSIRDGIAVISVDGGEPVDTGLRFGWLGALDWEN